MKKIIILFIMVFLASSTMVMSAAVHKTSTNATLTTNIEGTSDGVPVGSVIAWPMDSTVSSPDPNFWLECANLPVPPDSKLYSLMTVTPDYRGYFLRGLGGNSAAIGVAQGSAVGPHYHHLNRSTGGSGNNWIGNGGNGNRGDYTDSWGGGMSNETRPVNKAVRYMIKIN